MADLTEIYRQARSIRYFTKEAVTKQALMQILDNARIASNAMNRQQLRYLVVQDPTRVAYINEHIHFAALLGKASAFQKSHYPPVYIGIIQTHPPSI